MAFSPLGGIPFNKDQVAVAVAHSRFGGGHSGIAFHSAKLGPQVLHLAWHQKLEVDPLPGPLGNVCWVAAPLPTPPSASKQVVAIVRTVAARLPKINYGTDFISARGSFAADGSYKPPKGSTGLTCASFVIEVLRASKISVVQEATWQSDERNVRWANSVCDYLANTDPEHAEAVRKNINGLRIIPFEVAGAAASGPASWPVDYVTAQQLAQPVLAVLCALCPPPPGVYT